MEKVIASLHPYLVGAMIALGASAYFYVDYLKEENKTLTDNNKTLKENLLNEKKQCEEKLQVKEVVVKWKTKKVFIESKTKKETDEEAKSDTKPTNRIYLK